MFKGAAYKIMSDFKYTKTGIRQFQVTDLLIHFGMFTG